MWPCLTYHKEYIPAGILAHEGRTSGSVVTGREAPGDRYRQFFKASEFADIRYSQASLETQINPDTLPQKW